MTSTLGRLWALPLALLAVVGCAPSRPSASAVASSKEASARSASALPPLDYALEIERPASEEERSSIPWLEIRGRAGTAELFESDLVFVVDLSLSTMFPSGSDLDEDGVIGEMRGIVKGSTVARGQAAASVPGAADRGDLSGAVMRTGNAWRLHPRNWTTDRDDTIARAQLEAARILIDGLGPRRNRVGLITYTSKGRVRTKLGPARETREAIERIRLTGASPNTSVAAGLRQARLLLSQERADSDRQRAVLLFTDGRPNFPADEHLARIQALYAADALAGLGIDLYVFAFGKVGLHEARFLLELAGSAKGRLFRVMDPRRLLEDLPPVELAPRWLKIENTTTGEKARGIRSSQDGRFDAFVPLAAGVNRIRVLAELGNGQLQRWEQTVHYDPTESPSEGQLLATERVERELEARSADDSSDAAEGPPH